MKTVILSIFAFEEWVEITPSCNLYRSFLNIIINDNFNFTMKNNFCKRIWITFSGLILKLN